MPRRSSAGRPAPWASPHTAARNPLNQEKLLALNHASLAPVLGGGSVLGGIVSLFLKAWPLAPVVLLLTWLWILLTLFLTRLWMLLAPLLTRLRMLVAPLLTGLWILFLGLKTILRETVVTQASEASSARMGNVGIAAACSIHTKAFQDLCFI